MSYFRRQRTLERDPTLQLLLAEIAARQSSTPTALILSQPGGSEQGSDLPPEMDRFVAANSARRANTPVCGSFHSEVASALLTLGKPS